MWLLRHGIDKPSGGSEENVESNNGKLLTILTQIKTDTGTKVDCIYENRCKKVKMVQNPKEDKKY